MNSTRRDFLKNLTALGVTPFIDQDFRDFIDHKEPLVLLDSAYGNVIEAPENPQQWPAFRTALHAWRESKKKELGYAGLSYKDPAFAWTSSNYACCFLMMYDLEFFDPKQGTYTVAKILDRGKEEFGGYDSVVLWHAYPRIGIDERNQFDFYRDMPGGLEGVKKTVDEFHTNNVRVFINYNPWDVSTRREPGSDIDALIEIISSIGADGIFLDTLKEAGSDFRKKLDAVRPGLALEGELAAELEILGTHHLSWAQWFGDKFVPGILRDKWFERNHMQHQIARWDLDHSTELHQAWMNGSGMMIWENVFGQWIAWNDRDKSILRTMLPIQRKFHHLFSGEGWTPLVDTLQPGVFASVWEENGMRLWTLVNRYDLKQSGDLLRLPLSRNDTYYDIVAGEPATFRTEKNSVVLQGGLAPRSIGCFVAVKKNQSIEDWPGFLAGMKSIKEQYRGQTTVKEMTPVLKRVSRAPRTPLPSMGGSVEIQPITIRQTTEFIIRECGTYTSSPQVKMTLGQSIFFEKSVHIGHIAVDLLPVTNAQYSEFLKDSGYRPREGQNFLKHWTTGEPPPEKKYHPVVYVDLDDARAYAAWAGKRLPLEGEWQFAAQGQTNLKYPWGPELKDGFYNQTNDTTPADAFPLGRSHLGCLDLCGNVWQLTESEYADAHNRFCILKGGSYFNPKGSSWYTHGGPQPSVVATKFLMLHPGLDRCATVGFRCVRDL